MSTAESIRASQPPSAFWLWVLRQLATIGLALGFGLMGTLFLFTLFPPLQPFFHEARMPSLDLDIVTGLAMLVLTPLAIGYAFRRQRLNTSRGRIVFVVIAAAVTAADLILLAEFPAVAWEFESLLGISFWKVHAPVVALSIVNVTAVGLAAWPLRAWSARRLVRFAVIVAAVLVVDVVLAAYWPAILEGLPFSDRNFDRRVDALKYFVVLGAAIGLPPTIVLVAAWRFRLSWRWIVGGYLVLAPVLVYLAADDPVIRRPMTVDEIAPAFPGAEESFAVLMRYGRQHPLGRDFRSPSKIWRKQRVDGEALDPRKPLEWQTWLTRRRSEIEEDWAELAPVRAWWAELNAFDRIGDLTPPRYDAETISFQVVRALSQHACAIASLQALDGHGDEAIDTLLPVLEVGRKLQPSAPPARTADDGNHRRAARRRYGELRAGSRRRLSVGPRPLGRRPRCSRRRRSGRPAIDRDRIRLLAARLAR